MASVRGRPGTTYPAPVAEIRVVEVLAALALTTDLASGVAFEKGLRTCAVATAFTGALGLAGEERRAVFEAALLRAIGCTAHAPENGAMFGDDVAFQASLKELDPGDPAVFARQLQEFGSWAGADAPKLARVFQREAATTGPRAARAGCDVSRALGRRLGLTGAAIDALDEVYERWDGLGIPDGVAGDALTYTARIVHVAEQAVLSHETGGRAAALAEIRRRAGGHLDPDLVAAFTAAAESTLAPLAEPDILAAVLAAEPGPVAFVPFGDVGRLCSALAVVGDLKGLYLLGHSAHVAEVVTASGRLAGLEPSELADLRAAALVHDLGRVTVPSSVWDSPKPLGIADLERVRLYSYWTGRVLERVPALRPLALVASAHHERTDSTGYHRGVPAADLPFAARLLAAADVFAALTEPRPHRPAMSVTAAVAELVDAASAGQLDPSACAAMVEAAGLPRPRLPLPANLSEREAEVLRLAARGLSNRTIGTRLGISDRTVGHHLAHIYDKTEVRTRAGIAVFAMEHGLLRDEQAGVG